MPERAESQYVKVAKNAITAIALSTFIFFAPFIQVTCSHLCTSSHVFIQLCVCVQQLAGAQKNIFWFIYSNGDTNRGACNFYPITIWTQEVIRLLYGLNTSNY